MTDTTALRAVAERLRPWSEYSFHEMHQQTARDRFAEAVATIESAADHIDAQARALEEARAALDKIAAFVPKSGATNRSDINMDNAWNRAGEYAARIARAASQSLARREGVEG